MPRTPAAGGNATSIAVPAAAHAGDVRMPGSQSPCQPGCSSRLVDIRVDAQQILTEQPDFGTNRARSGYFVASNQVDTSLTLLATEIERPILINSSRETPLVMIVTTACPK